MWGGAPVVPWLTGDEAGPESGDYVGADGVGTWSHPDNLACDQPRYASIAAYLEAVHRTLTEEQKRTPWAPMCPAWCGGA